MLLAGSTSKVVVGAAIAESCIQALNLKATTPTSMGIHLGMDSTTGAAGIEIVAASTTQNAYIDFTYPGVQNRGRFYTVII